MKIIVLALTLLTGGFQLGGEEEAAYEVNTGGQICITGERIIKPVRSWKVLKTEIRYEGKTPFMEISFHNPLNKKTPVSIDAKFVLRVDPSMAKVDSLVAATYFNPKTNVTFKRIYSVHDVTVKSKVQKFPMQTPCFAREVVQIIEFTPDEVKVPESSSDGGTK